MNTEPQLSHNLVWFSAIARAIAALITAILSAIWAAFKKD